MWPETKAALRWLNKMYNEDLMLDLTVVEGGSIGTQMQIDGETGIIHGPIFVGYGAIYEKMRIRNPDARLKPVFPWTSDPDGPYYNDFFVKQYGLGFITPSTTKYPQQVVQYLNYMASEEGRRTEILGVEGKDWGKTPDGGFRRLISDQEITERIAWVQPQWEILSMAFDKAYLNAQAAYGSMAHADEYIQWVREMEENYPPTPAPVVNLPAPAWERYYSVIEGDWNNAVPKIITASPADLDALVDQAVASFRDNGGDEIAEEAIANYRQWVGQ